MNLFINSKKEKPTVFIIKSENRNDTSLLSQQIWKFGRTTNTLLFYPGDEVKLKIFSNPSVYFIESISDNELLLKGINHNKNKTLKPEPIKTRIQAGAERVSI